MCRRWDLEAARRVLLRSVFNGNLAGTLRRSLRRRQAALSCGCHGPGKAQGRIPSHQGRIPSHQKRVITVIPVSVARSIDISAGIASSRLIRCPMSLAGASLPLAISDSIAS